MTNGNLELDTIKAALKKHLNESEQMWADKEKSEAFIVGYLQGTIKQVINYIQELKDND
jgi:hypothetical protein